LEFLPLCLWAAGLKWLSSPVTPDQTCLNPWLS